MFASLLSRDSLPAESRSQWGSRAAHLFTALSLALCVALGTLVSYPASAQRQADAPKGTPQPQLPTINLSIKGITVRAEVANTDATRQMGMMFRTSMGKNDGMLFVFEQPGYYAMWMRNTLIPLSVAYMDAKGVIVSIHEMEPLNETPHQAAGPVIFALEMNTKWFAKNGVKAGDTIKGLEKAPKAK